jgi:alpha-glucoside transport system substrate-binding protein
VYAPTRSLAWRAGILSAALALVIAACGDGGATSPGAATPPPDASPTMDGGSPAAEDLSGQTVSVIGTWGGNEQEVFLSMVAPWEERTGATVEYTGTRDLNQILATAIASGTGLPDLAGLPGPGQMTEWADSLVDLNEVLDVETYRAETAAPLVELGTVDAKLVGVFIKAAVKGLIWYNPTVLSLDAPPATWDELQSIAQQNASAADATWCVGIESAAATGWPATDWLEDIVLRQAGPDVYNSWWQGQTKWSDPAIKQAWETFGQVVENSYGGRDTVATTNFEVAGDPLFASPPGCLLHHQGSFITGLGAFQQATAGTDYDFFPFPDIDPQHSGAIEGAGDLFGMFNDTPAARSLMAYLVTAEAQDIWVKAGGAISANKNATSYPDEIGSRSAELLVSAETFVFDASDLMPAQMNEGFWRGVTQFVQDPSQLDSILANLDQIQADAYSQ